MLREAKNAAWLAEGRRWSPRYRFAAGGVAGTVALRRGRWEAEAARQVEAPVAVHDEDGRRWWWFHDRFWWEDDDLDAADVMALVLEHERRLRRRLDRAHALMGAEGDAPAADRAGRTGDAPRRTAIPTDVKRAVWARDGGRCVTCRRAELLEFDHVIPLAMGGSSTARNLQLLCAECNRVKGAAL